MQTISVSDQTLDNLKEAAARRGMDANTYAEELLSLSLAVLREKQNALPDKPYRAMQFSGIAPTGRTAEEIDAELEAARNEWDN